jgi:hypothetical protein
MAAPSLWWYRIGLFDLFTDCDLDQTVSKLNDDPVREHPLISFITPGPKRTISATGG